MPDQETIEVYNNSIDDYVKVSDTGETDPTLETFMSYLSADDLVLDLGCGPAIASAAMAERGFRVDPVDASTEMVAFANRKYGLNARVGTFHSVDKSDHYDAVWANFSLLHASKDEFPDHLKAIFKALKPGGYFHIGMKTGEGELRDRLGRQYAYYTSVELKEHLISTGFTIIESTDGEGVGLAGDVSPWTAIISAKPA